MEMDFNHVIFPDVPMDLTVQRQREIARKLEEIGATLEREKRDLQREVQGGEPREGVGVAVAAELNAIISTPNPT